MRTAICGSLALCCSTARAFLGSQAALHLPSALGGSPVKVPMRCALEVNPMEDLEAGSVLVASPDDYGHFTMKSVALVIEVTDAGTRAVCLDRGSPFTVGEMTGADIGPLRENRLYRGGEDGGTAVVMLHPYDLPGAEMVGRTGLFQGGLGSAVEAVSSGEAAPADFKFFFNFMEWQGQGLQEQIARGKWQLVSLSDEALLSQKPMVDQELWSTVRRRLKAMPTE
ncbi:unnamed protein product [Chrysoparadoxa australica]